MLKKNPACKFTFVREKSSSIHFYFKSTIIFIIDDQPFLPINPFAEPITTTTMSSMNSNHHHDDDMIDIDFRNTTNDQTNSKFIK